MINYGVCYFDVVLLTHLESGREKKLSKDKSRPDFEGLYMLSVRKSGFYLYTMGSAFIL